MDSEQIIIPQGSAKTINDALDQKKRVCAVGTTVMRSIESSVSANQRLNAFRDGRTSLSFSL